MRVFIAVLVLIFNLQSWTKADDISDFEIEGMSIGDSLLDYFTLNEIEAHKMLNYYKHIKKNPGKFIAVEFDNYDGDIYSILQFSIKKNDNKYKIYMIKGALPYKNDMIGCIKKQKEVDNQLSKMFANLKKKEFEDSLESDTSDGKLVSITYWFKSEDLIDIDCYDWSEESGHLDHLRIGATAKEFNYWLIEK